MNNPRRKQLAELSEKISELRGLLETLKDEEEEYMENIPENLQSSARYEKAEDAVDNLDSALDSQDDALSCIESAIE